MIFEQMRVATLSIVEQIQAHAFNQELANGTLPKEKFTHYLIQDALYLADFSRALALVGARLADNQHAQQFMQFAVDAIQAERSLHANYLREFNVVDYEFHQASPACFMYTNYLLKTAALHSVEEAVASLLPCFWIYREVAKQIARTQSAANPYQKWIALYASEQFDVSVQTAIEIVVALGNSASDAVKAKMIAAFVRSAQLEWLFWESAYVCADWCV